MTSDELKAARKNKGMTQAKFAAWLGVKTRTLIAWENDQNPIPDVAINRIRDSEAAPSLNPKMTLDVFNKAQLKAKEEGFSDIEEWIAHLISKAVQMLVFLCVIAKLIQSPTDWSGEALAQAAGTGLSWFGTGIAWAGSLAWQAGSALLGAVL